MSKVITFSRFFPACHPKKGQPTFFVEKIWEGMMRMKWPELELSAEQQRWFGANFAVNIYDTKYHTIRAGNRWKVGDKFSPRVWLDKPYRSKQIIIAPDIEIKKIWKFEIIQATEWECDWYINDAVIYSESYKALATNDGLTMRDMSDWFVPDITKVKSRTVFSGQILCWNESIIY